MNRIITIMYVVLLIYAAYVDVKTLKVKRWVNILILILSIFNIRTNLIGAVIITAPFLIIAVWKNCFGGGDIKFIFVNACMLGFDETYVALIIAFAILSFQYLIVKRKKDKGNNRVPLLPYLVTGFLLVLH